MFDILEEDRIAELNKGRELFEPLLPSEIVIEEYVHNDNLFTIKLGGAVNCQVSYDLIKRMSTYNSVELGQYTNAVSKTLQIFKTLR